MTLDYHCARTSDTYTVVLRHSVFDHALRYVGRIGSEPMVYDTLEEIPEPHRSEIENLIEWKTKS